ncbi:MAG: hypothetical protein GIKADHBN_02161 [Phycisphaerales bacterium]|nr:hypothetical protein [Phycisphaerales bacterium]
MYTPVMVGYSHPYIPGDLDEFLSMTGWPPPLDDIVRARMAKALGYFQDRVQPKSELGEPCSFVERFGPTALNLKINGRITRLCAWMQSIDFRYHVNPDFQVPNGYHLKAFRVPPEPGKRTYRSRAEKKNGRHLGEYYTFESARVDGLGLPSDQSFPRIFRATTAFTCLRTTVADAYISWRAEGGYSSGGGNQLIILNAEEVLEELSTGK